MTLKSKMQARRCFLMAAGLLMFAGCSGGGNPQPVDAFLNEYQSRVEKWEAKAKTGPLSLTDLQQLGEEAKKNMANMLELGKKHKWSVAQAERSKGLSSRMQQIVIANTRRQTPPNAQ
ncbi:MAG: hypothetical protein HY735_18950 [Verrucomicrobia bacterium]|nr:hypothetical protein [Verrucomicrobiota bacterium]